MKINFIVFFFMVIALLSCKNTVISNPNQTAFESDSTLFDGGSAEEHFHWCHVYKYRKVKDNYGTNCPSHKSGLCINLEKEKISNFEDDGLIGIAYDNHQTFRCYIPRNSRDEISEFEIEDTVVIWDDEFIDAYGLELPVIVFPKKYKVGCAKDYFFIDLPLIYVVLKKNVLVFINGWNTEKTDWVFDEFYDGFLGENDVLTGVVAEINKTALTIEFRYGYNISNAESAITQMLENGMFEFENNIIIEKQEILRLLGLDHPITLKSGSYDVVKCNDGARVCFEIVEYVGQ